ncbi:MAG: GNAT family N-acetyltransferase [Candidatus Omnitrophica bacterium]|nr:GNAT family N-acetyltransferase [Candidatus Omnitrophota bacterium]MDD5237954.1 GNAT family N-acetyltransferase [Candidatus Omnitrophota bacterium]
MEEIIIRRYKKIDRPFVREIAWDTAFIGKPADVFFEDKDILMDFLTQYFTDYEPQSCFIAESNNLVMGYLIGAKGVSLLKDIFQFKIFPKLLIKVIKRGTLFRKKNIIFIFNCFLSFLRREFQMPDFNTAYPAILHINIRANFRNLNAGSRLIAAYLNYLSQEKIPGVHLATMSDEAGEFFRKQGFIPLHKGKRSYFRYILQKDLPLYIYGKKLQ